MKRIFTLFSAALIFAACNGNKDEVSTTLPIPADTLNAHTAAADNAAQIDMSALSDTLYTSQGKYIRMDALPQQTTVVQHRSTPRSSQPRVVRATPVYTPAPTPAPMPAPAPAPTETAGTGNDNENSNVGTGTDEGTNNGTVAQAPVEKKKGWSKAAKGAVIGGATGAVAGAIFSKNKAAGAVIGGIIGAGGGYAIGRSKDKKDAAKTELMRFP